MNFSIFNIKISIPLRLDKMPVGGLIALLLLLLLGFIVIASFSLPPTSESRSLIAMLLGPVVALVGVTSGFFLAQD